MRSVLATVLALTVAGCGHPTPPRKTQVQIVAAPAGGKGEPYAAPISEKQDGTGALIDLLLRAQKDGARSMSDVAFYVTGHDGGKALTCRRDLVAGPAVAASSAEAYPRLVTREVTDSVYECTTKTTTVTHTVTTYKSIYNPVTKLNASIPEKKEVTEDVPKETCGMVPKTSTATRYEHEIEAGFAPPTLTGFRPTYTALELHLAAPVCAPAAIDKPANRIEATIYKN